MAEQGHGLSQTLMKLHLPQHIKPTSPVTPHHWPWTMYSKGGLEITLGIEASEDTNGYQEGRLVQLYTHTLL